MKSYTIKNTGKSKVAAALASQLEVGKAGEVLVRDGFSQQNFTRFLANLAVRAVKAGYDEGKVASTFMMVAAGNASQARQAMADITITFEGEKEQSLGKLWGNGEVSVKPDLSLLADV